MLTVALTGNVASGKTTVADRWREAGVRVIDADRLGHEVLAGDATVRAALESAFGPSIVDRDGAIDRAALGAAAFETPEATARLNAIVHPPLLARLEEALDRAEREGATMVVVDAALTFEFGLDARMDRVVLVTAPAEVRQQRLVRDRRMTSDQAARIMASQRPDAEKALASDVVIVNDGSVAELRDRADAALTAIRESIGTQDEGGGR